MDEKIQKDVEITDDGGISLGSGVDIVQPGGDIDDIEIESYNDDVTAGGGAMTPEDHIKRLRLKLRETVEEKQGYLDGWQRLKADFVNYKKREDEGKEEFIKFARESLISDLLPVLESFHMAFANQEAWEKVDPSWRKGVEHIHAQLIQILEGHGLSEIDPVNKDFDPKEHESVGNVSTEDTAKHHKIAEVVQLGYRLNGKMVKPPKVKVYSE